MSDQKEKLEKKVSSEKIRKRHEKSVERARVFYERQMRYFEESEERYNKFLEYNDEQLKKFQKSNDEKLKQHRKKVDARLVSNREKIRDRYIKGDLEKEKKLQERIKNTDEFLERQRQKANEARKKHRKRVSKGRKKNEERTAKYYKKVRDRALERYQRIEEDEFDLIAVKRFKVMMYTGAILFVTLLALEFILPGTKLKRYNIIDDTPIQDTLGLPTKPYDETDQTEEEILWNLLNDHYDGNQTAVLGVMCNLRAESRFAASNLEDYNNGLWDLNDEDYTEKINRKTITKDDFMESRYINVTNGYYNGYSQWVNTDGGYGYAQYTAYEKKKALYAFAEEWFGKGGQGEQYRFDISDPKMQAHFIVHLLESDEYKNMDSQIRNAPTVVDACYIWLKYYEVPYDPYNDGYYTLAFDRAVYQNEILKNCTQKATEESFDHDY